MLVSEPVCSLLSAICMPHTAESFKNSKAGQSQVFDIYMIQESWPTRNTNQFNLSTPFQRTTLILDNIWQLTFWTINT